MTVGVGVGFLLPFVARRNSIVGDWVGVGVGVNFVPVPLGGRVGLIPFGVGVGVTVGELVPDVPGGLVGLGLGVRVGKILGVGVAVGKSHGVAVGPVTIGAGGGVGCETGAMFVPPVCFFIAVRMRSSLGSGGKSVKSGCVLLI
jgi:hypothetical protein